MKDSERNPSVLLQENVAAMSLLATRALYDEQPELWKLGRLRLAPARPRFPSTHALRARES